LQYKNIFIIVLKNNIVYREYNHIDKFDFLKNYQYIQLEILQSNTIRNTFTAIDLIPVDTEKVFSKSNTFLTNIYTTKQSAR